MTSKAIIRAGFLGFGTGVLVVGTISYFYQHQVPYVPRTYPPPSGSFPTSIQDHQVPKSPIPFGPPGPVTDELYRTAYISSFNRALRNPNWVFEHLTPESVKWKEGVDRGSSAFKEDTEVPEKFRTRLQDYFKSGFDRGHMAPASDARMSQEALDETFLLTNIAPQVGDGFNRHYWAYFERFVRKLTNEFPHVYVFTGPLYLPKKDADNKWYVKYQMIGRGDSPLVAVPTNFFKVILAIKSDGEASLGSFILPNEAIRENTPLQEYAKPLGTIEEATGLEFFPRLSEEQRANLKDLCKTTKCEVVIKKFGPLLQAPKP